MAGYGQFCPIAKAAEILCERWTALVIRSLAAGAVRFNDIHRGVPLMSVTLLSKRLKQLEAEGVIARERDGKRWAYRLTERGAEFVPVIMQLGTWGRRWKRRALEEGEIDHGLLIWGLEHCIDGGAFGPARSVVRIEFTDQPGQKRLLWFVNEGGAAEMCVSDPGHEVDLYLAASLRDMIHIYRGDIGVAEAIGSGRLEALGPRRMVARLKAWLNLGPLAEVPPAA